MRRRDGMTLVEVVVAMSVVVIISFAALATVLFGAESFENQQFLQYAVNEADNVIACLQSDDPSAALKFAYGVDVDLTAVKQHEGTYYFVLSFPGERYVTNGSGDSEVSVSSLIRLEADKNPDVDAAILEMPDCAVRVLVYLTNGPVESSEEGGNSEEETAKMCIRVDEIVVDSRHIKSGNTRLSRAYRMTEPLTIQMEPNISQEESGEADEGIQP